MTKVLRYGQEYEKPVVLAMGFFDCVHLGHAKVIGEARRLASLAGAECAVLTFSNDPSARLGKGKQIYTLRDRLEVFASLCADAALVADFDDSFMATSAHDFTNTLSSTLHLVGLTPARTTPTGQRAREMSQRSGNSRTGSQSRSPSSPCSAKTARSIPRPH